MPKRTRSFRSWQLEKLSDPKIAKNYLNAALDDPSPEVFFRALGKVAQANQMTRVAKGSGIQRETLYRSLSEQGNPTYGTLSSIFGFLGLKFKVDLVENTAEARTFDPAAPFESSEDSTGDASNIFVYSSAPNRQLVAGSLSATPLLMAEGEMETNGQRAGFFSMMAQANIAASAATTGVIHAGS